ncbi:MAG TPA: hydroxymethylbilane synthase [Syntrophomonadaceae bacterium]|nr:hydroxymethylbilane synthase [Syntrophomonadaceae bacterium]
MSSIRVGTRGSKLALWQADDIARQLQDEYTDIQVETVIIHTRGDKILDVALSKIGDKGIFTKEIEKELIEKRIDLAVHSLKDLPTVLDSRVCIGAVTRREYPGDVLVSHKAYTLDELPVGARIGTSSLRRVAQLKHYRPDLQCVDLRGNVGTRIRKMKEQDLDGIVLAYAGVKRLGYESFISENIPYDIMLPAVGQGAIAIEIRSDDPITLDYLASIHDPTTEMETTAERAFLKELEGGCQIPVACLATRTGEEISIQGLVASLDGTQVYRDSLSCPATVEDAEQAGQKLARHLNYMGAEAILREIRTLGEDR